MNTASQAHHHTRKHLGEYCTGSTLLQFYILSIPVKLRQCNVLSILIKLRQFIVTSVLMALQLTKNSMYQGCNSRNACEVGIWLD